MDTALTAIQGVKERRSVVGQGEGKGSAEMSRNHP
jgi:hypothetical protein